MGIVPDLIGSFPNIKRDHQFVNINGLSSCFYGRYIKKLSIKYIREKITEMTKFVQCSEGSGSSYIFELNGKIFLAKLVSSVLTVEQTKNGWFVGWLLYEFETEVRQTNLFINLVNKWTINIILFSANHERGWNVCKWKANNESRLWAAEPLA